MCIIVDPPLFVPIFKQSDPEHPAYLPVFNWITTGTGKFVMGGSMYKEELSKVASVLKLLQDLERKGKIVRISNASVDAEVIEVKRIKPTKDFDDPHLVALVRASGCRLICIRDPRAHKYLREATLYRTAKSRPKLYTRPKNSHLLCANNCAPCCK